MKRLKSIIDWFIGLLFPAPDWLSPHNPPMLSQELRDALSELENNDPQ